MKASNLVLVVFVIAACQTTSALATIHNFDGNVYDNEGNPLPGATVQAWINNSLRGEAVARYYSQTNQAYYTIDVQGDVIERGLTIQFTIDGENTSETGVFTPYGNIDEFDLHIGSPYEELEPTTSTTVTTTTTSTTSASESTTSTITTTSTTPTTITVTTTLIASITTPTMLSTSTTEAATVTSTTSSTTTLEAAASTTSSTLTTSTTQPGSGDEDVDYLLWGLIASLLLAFIVLALVTLFLIWIFTRK